MEYIFRLPQVGEEPQNVTMKFAFEGSDDNPSFRIDSKIVACRNTQGSVFYLYFLQVSLPFIEGNNLEKLRSTNTLKNISNSNIKL